MSEKNQGGVKRTAKDTADPVAVGIVTILSWAIPTFSGADIPHEVVGAFGAMAGGFAARLRD